MSADIETIVIGAGVIGLAIARARAARGHSVMILEQHALIGSETSSRNSEVIHAGLYYRSGSLRARLCVRGKDLLYDFCRENAIAHKRCGKLLVATSEDQLPDLNRIKARAAANGVVDLQDMTAHEAARLEPNLACVAALHSPSTGVVDTHGLMTALEGHISYAGGEIVLGTKVTGLSLDAQGGFIVDARSQGVDSRISCKTLVLAAGLGASNLGALLHYPQGYQPPRTYPAKGHYFTLSGKAPFSRLIYPMPKGAWLGIHQTLDHSGQTKFGPDIYWLPDPALPCDYGFEKTDERRQIFAREIRRYYPGLDAAKLQPGYTGLRPKLYREGEPVADFAIHDRGVHGIAGLIALYGIESPGLTASLAIGDYVAERL